jgi:REP element-mobilizing transposase RayT
MGTSPLQRKQRLKRLDWVFSDRPLYFVTACVEGRRAVLANQLVFEAFQQFCLAGLERGFFVGRFVLMPDHLHLFVVVPQNTRALSIWMKGLKRSLTRVLDEAVFRLPIGKRGSLITSCGRESHTPRSGTMFAIIR